MTAAMLSEVHLSPTVSPDELDPDDANVEV
jgi:hypothetical protein